MNTNKDDRISRCFQSSGYSEADINSAMNSIAKLRAEEKAFGEYFDNNFKNALFCSECFYVVISQAVKEYSSYLNELSDEIKMNKAYTLTALESLLKRAMQQFLEINTLVKNGFSDGAFARWRSMYELSVISSFILKYGEDTAKSFIEASDSEDRYDWAMASKELPETKRHVTFGDILKRCDIDTEVWRENYTVANQTVHASSQGTFDRLGAQDGKLSNARSAYGIAAPAINSAETLALIASMYLSVFAEEKSVKRLKLGTKLLSELSEAYIEVHEREFEK